MGPKHGSLEQMDPSFLGKYVFSRKLDSKHGSLVKPKFFQFKKIVYWGKLGQFLLKNMASPCSPINSKQNSLEKFD